MSYHRARRMRVAEVGLDVIEAISEAAQLVNESSELAGLGHPWLVSVMR